MIRRYCAIIGVNWVSAAIATKLDRNHFKVEIKFRANATNNQTVFALELNYLSWVLYALDTDGQRIRATPGIVGRCDMCGEKLIPKCGRIVTHHWAHKGEDCDSWREPETEWHRYWKSMVPSDYSEVAIERNGLRHRADIVTKSGIVIELQHSPLGVDEIAIRESFYGKMIWLFDVRTCRPTHSEKGILLPSYAKAIRLRLRPKEGKKDFHTFRWAHPRRSVAYAKSPTYLDVGSEEILKLEWMSKDTPCGGKGILKP